MRDLLVFASLVALGLAIRGVLRIPAHMVPSGLLPYLATQAAFTSCAWIASQRFAYSASGYAKIYCLTAAVMLAALVWYTSLVLFAVRMPFLLFVAGVVAVGFAIALRSKLGGGDVLRNFLHLEAAAFIACGLVVLASLVELESGLSNRLRLLLGVFWLLQGFFLYGYCIGTTVVRLRAAAILHASWIFSFVALAAWAWLAMYLAGLQAELVKQNDTSTELLEVRWLSWQGESYRRAVQIPEEKYDRSN